MCPIGLSRASLSHSLERKKISADISPHSANNHRLLYKYQFSFRSDETAASGDAKHVFEANL